MCTVKFRAAKLLHSSHYSSSFAIHCGLFTSCAHKTINFLAKRERSDLIYFFASHTTGILKILNLAAKCTSYSHFCSQILGLTLYVWMSLSNIGQRCFISLNCWHTIFIISINVEQLQYFYLQSV